MNTHISTSVPNASLLRYGKKCDSANILEHDNVPFVTPQTIVFRHHLHIKSIKFSEARIWQ